MNALLKYVNVFDGFEAKSAISTSECQRCHVAVNGGSTRGFTDFLRVGGRDMFISDLFR